MSTEITVTAARTANADTGERYYEWRARCLLKDLADYEFLAATVARCNDALNESYVRDSGCGAIRYDKVIAGRNIGGERLYIGHEPEITRRDTIRAEMSAAAERMAAVDDMLAALDDTTRRMAIDKYRSAEFDLILEERYDMTRQGIRRRIMNAVVDYCKNVDKLS